MLCLQSFSKYSLAVAALGCLSLGGLAPTVPLPLVDSSTNPDTSHRGSGRLVTQALEAGAIAYRGTGRLDVDNSESSGIIVSHRGSGRIQVQTPEPNTISYRGSGRIASDRSVIATVKSCPTSEAMA